MRIKAIIVRILPQLVHDKRTVALMIMAPIFVLTLMSLIFDNSSYYPKIAIVNAPINFVNKLEDKEAKVMRYSEADALQGLKNSEIDAIINFEHGIPKIKLEGADPNKSTAVIKLAQNTLLQASYVNNEPDITYLYGYDNMESFDNFGPIFIGFFVFFFVFLISGVSFLKERTTGTLERILATPLKRYEIVIGYLIGFGIFTIVQAALIAWFSINILNMMMVGSFILVLLITILTAMVALSLGTFLSAFANNELQIMQFIPIVIVPQVFFSGLFDLSTMPHTLQYFARFMPLWYSADALRNIMIRGKGFSDIVFDALILILICIIFAIANTFALKKYRKI